MPPGIGKVDLHLIVDKTYKAYLEVEAAERRMPVARLVQVAMETYLYPEKAERSRLADDLQEMGALLATLTPRLQAIEHGAQALLTVRQDLAQGRQAVEATELAITQRVVTLAGQVRTLTWVGGIGMVGAWLIVLILLVKRWVL